jgi:hypothetical protein
LNLETTSWNEVLVRQSFLPSDAEAILKIPICDQLEDCVAWHPDSKGIFSVKSAYKIYVLAQDDGRQVGQSNGNIGSEWETNIWNRLWKLDCPPKVHHFLWRFARDSLPLRMNIEKRHVELDTRCAVCKAMSETGGHLFIACRDASKVWSSLALDHVRQRLLSCNSAMEVMDQVLDLSYDEKMKAVALLWCWWTERNKANRGERRLPLNILQVSINNYTEEWRVHLKKDPKKPMNQIQSWQPPPVDWVLLNTDGAFSYVTNRGGWGAIARDHDGDMIIAEAGSVPSAANAFHTETYAVLRAIDMAVRLGFGRIIIATDCQNLQRAITSSEFDLAELGVLFCEVKFLLQTEFIEHRVIFVPRVCNKPAHELATLGLNGVSNEHQVWLDQVPVDVSRALYGDSTVQI